MTTCKTEGEDPHPSSQADSPKTGRVGSAVQRQAKET